MDPKHEDLLCDIGLARNEAKVYLALLNLGECSAGDIADFTKLHRPNVYDALDRLKLKGLVSFYMNGKSKMYRAADPKNIRLLIKEKENLLDQVISQLELERELTTKKTFAETYEGLKALRNAFFELLDHNKPIFIFGVPAHAPGAIKSFVDQFHVERRKRKIMMKHIYNQDAAERIKYLNAMDYTEAAYLPEKFNTPISTMVCGEDVLLINWKPIVFVRIRNQMIADSYAKYCELMLKSAKM